VSNHYAEFARRQKQLERRNRLEQKRLEKRELRAARRDARREAHTGHVSDTDPTEGMEAAE
jgi:hypothetical protein